MDHRLKPEEELEIKAQPLGKIGPSAPEAVAEGLDVLTGNSIGTWTDNMGGSGQKIPHVESE